MPRRSFAIGLASLILMLPTALRADDGPVTPAPTIDPLPAGWTRGEDKPEMHRGQNLPLKVYFDVIAEPKEIAFAAWCKKVQEREIKKCPFSDEVDTPLVAAKIGGYAVMSYESSGTVFGGAVRCRVYCIELPDKFARLMCSGDESTWDQAKATFDDLVKNMK